MKTVDFIRMALDRSAKATLALIEDMKDQPLTFPTPKGGNHPLWVLGHIACSEGEIIQHIMLGRSNPLEHYKSMFGRGSEPSAEAARYPAFEEVKKAFQDVRAETMKVLDTLTDADLDQPSKACPAEFNSLLGTCGQCFLITIFNTLTHRGQVADVRRAAGRKPLRM
jgi:uncharacterized damage-inducible protein DinB